jgi:hypothetical protein
MLKYRTEAPAFDNQTLGQKSTLTLDSGYRYHLVDVILTVAKTAATSGFTSATIADVLDLIDIKVDTKSRRQHTAAELDAIQTRWSPLLSVTAIDGVANDLVTAVDDQVVGSDTTRTTTFIFPLLFAEPLRDSYTAREAFAWPTLWPTGRRAKIQIVLSTLAPDGFDNLAIRAEQVYDLVFGPTINGKEAMPITHFYRDNITYASTNVMIDKFPFAFPGRSLQQFSLFCPTDDDVATFEIKGDKTTIKQGTKATSDNEADRYGCNPDGVNDDRFDYLFDFTDDPTDALRLSDYNKLSIKLGLTQAAADNKDIVAIYQVYEDAFA